MGGGGGFGGKPYQISNLMVLVGRLHFCVKKAAVVRGQCPPLKQPRIAGGIIPPIVGSLFS